MNPESPEQALRTTAPAVERMPLVDALKGIAAQLILVHHLVSYGPLAEAAGRVLPALSGWLFDYGRMVVQLFFVAGGFLAARSLAPDGAPAAANPLRLIWRRYTRLAPPFIVAMAIALGAALLASRWMSSDAVPEVLDIGQFVAHGLLLHGVLDIPSLSAGVWYVAIDMQLYVLLVLLLHVAGRIGGRHAPALAQVMVAALGGAALLFFNRISTLDDWGIYFFGSYALGLFAWWLGDRRRAAAGLVVMTLAVALAMFVEFRLRIVIAFAVALLLAVARRQGWLSSWPQSRLLGFLGRISFSLFLLHFPILLLINALFVRLGGRSDAVAMAAMAVAWGLSVFAGLQFFRHVENRRHWLPAGWVAGLRGALSAGRR